MTLSSDEARKVLDHYLRKLDRSVRTLPDAMQTDLRDEITSHIAESMEASTKATELDRLLDALDRLGDPEKFMRPMIADYRVEIATSTFNPRHMLRALAANLGAGVVRTFRYTLFSLLYLTLFSFVIMLIAKAIFPAHTGLFVVDQEFKAFGVVSDTQNLTEVLGLWLYPILIAACFVEYMAISLLMKVTRIRSR